MSVYQSQTLARISLIIQNKQAKMLLKAVKTVFFRALRQVRRFLEVMDSHEGMVTTICHSRLVRLSKWLSSEFDLTFFSHAPLVSY